MEASERKKLVAELLAGNAAVPKKEAAALNARPEGSYRYVLGHLRRYVLAKYMLPPDCRENNIRALARLSLEITLKLDENTLRELDQATLCNHATSETTKKVLLLYAVQRDLNLPENAPKLAAVQTLQELAHYIVDARKERQTGDAARRT